MKRIRWYYLLVVAFGVTAANATFAAGAAGTAMNTASVATEAMSQKQDVLATLQALKAEYGERTLRAIVTVHVDPADPEGGIEGAKAKVAAALRKAGAVKVKPLYRLPTLVVEGSVDVLMRGYDTGLIESVKLDGLAAPT